MKGFFYLMVALSGAALVWGCYEALRTTAHLHSDDRDRTLRGLQEPAYIGHHRNAYFGVTRGELSKCDGAVIQAYEASVGEANRLAAGYDRLGTGFNVLAVLLLATGSLGLRALDANKRPATR